MNNTAGNVLIADRVRLLFTIVEELRNKLIQLNSPIKNLSLIQEQLSDFADLKPVDAFLQDCEISIKNGVMDFAISREFSFGESVDFILSFFSAPYNSKLSLEMLVFDYYNIDRKLAKISPSKAKMIEVYYATAGFSGINDITLFPENFVCQKPIHGEYPSFYFINRFKDRFKSQGLVLIREFCDCDRVDDLSALEDLQIEHCFLHWLHLHEHFHRVGAFPLPENLLLKQSRSTAAFEEMRVDLNTILALYDLNYGSAVDSKVTAFLVFAERLVRYASLKHPQDNFDARAGQVLLNMLLENNSIHFTNSKLLINGDSYIAGLRQILEKFNQIEQKCVGQEFTQQKKIITNFIEHYGGKDLQSRKFELHPFFQISSDYARNLNNDINLEAFF